MIGAIIHTAVMLHADAFPKVFSQTQSHAHRESAHSPLRIVRHNDLVNIDATRHQIRRRVPPFLLPRPDVRNLFGVLDNIQAAPLRLDQMRVHPQQRGHCELPKILQDHSLGLATQSFDCRKQRLSFRRRISLREIYAVRQSGSL